MSKSNKKRKATKKDLDALDEYIADLMKKISVEGYYGEGRAAEKALLESDPSLPFSKLVKIDTEVLTADVLVLEAVSLLKTA